MGIKTHSDDPNVEEVAHKAEEMIRDRLNSLGKAETYDYGGHDIKIGEYDVNTTWTTAIAEAQQARDAMQQLASETEDPTLAAHFELAARYFEAEGMAAEARTMLHSGHGTEGIVDTLVNFVNSHNIEEQQDQNEHHEEHHSEPPAVATNDEVVKRHLENLKQLIGPRGLFLASSDNVVTGYDKAWLRDNVYEALAFEYANDWAVVEKTYHSLLDIFDKHIDKINWAVTNKPFESWQFIHARYNPDTLEEFWESWGNKQHDAVGAVLFKLADFEAKGHSMIRNDQDRKTVQTLIDYICNVEYWHDSDSGMWEENEEVHASSIGAVVAGLKKWQEVGGFNVDQDAIDRGMHALNELLPRESETKFTDLALISLIYPYRVVSDDQAREILGNLEYHLERDKGLIRYKFDRYYNKNDDGYSEEAEWCFGLSWLAICYKTLGDHDKAAHYLERARQTITPDGKVPELYYSQSDEPNENTPLGWSESMFVVAAIKMSS